MTLSSTSNGGDDNATLDKYAGKGATFHYAYIINTPFFSSLYGYWHTCMTTFRTIADDESSAQHICDSKTGCVGVVDTGTSFMIVPQQRWDTFLSVTGCVERGTDFLPACPRASSLDDFPAFYMVLGGVQFNVRPTDYAGCSLGKCVLFASKGADWLESFVWGDRFLSRFLLKFDVENKRVGFGCSPTSNAVSHCNGTSMAAPVLSACGIYPNKRTQWWVYFLEGTACGVALLVTYKAGKALYRRRRALAANMRAPLLDIASSSVEM